MNLAQNPQIPTPKEQDNGCSALMLLGSVIIALVLLGMVVFGIISERINQVQAERAQSQAQVEQARVQQEKELTERARINQEAERHAAELRADNTNQAMSLLTPIIGLGALTLLFVVADSFLSRRTMLIQEHAAKMRILELQEQQRLLALSLPKDYYLPAMRTVNQAQDIE